ncbi:MAG: tRNA epoxyqueuosine(34) reductase QueG, partial [Melioribacteraceae bacterium]|nr:tRNA epoxyqueuosine(34) reductase QueG [Melioribacteraceae bacterium]
MKLSNSIVIEKAKNLGFDLIGFSNAEKLDTEIEYLNKWIDKGFHSKMAYMERNIEKRENVKEILENAESVISLGMNYYRNKNFSND